MEDIQLLNHPYIQQSLQAKRSSMKEDDLEKNVKLPYVIKDKVLMAPGVWNNYFYPADAVKRAFDSTDWSDKEITSLFLDHADRSAREWAGEVRNPRMVGDELHGDLFIVDKPTAMKLAFGAKLGISPKVSGDSQEGTMVNFLYDNFSVVINPAVKKAYINNSQMDNLPEHTLAKELDPQAKVRNRGDVVFSAESSKVKDKQDHFPINDMDQARNALARAAQFDSVPPWFDGSLEELQRMVKEAVKRKYPDIQVSGLQEEGNKMSEQPVVQEQKQLSEMPPAAVQNDLQEFVQFAEKYLSEHAGKKISDAKLAFEAKKVDPVMATLQDACAKIEDYGKMMTELSGRIAKLEESLPKIKDNSPSLDQLKADVNAPHPEPAKLMNEAVAVAPVESTPAVESAQALATEAPAPVTQEMQQNELTDATSVPTGKRSFYMSETSASESDYALYELVMKL